MANYLTFASAEPFTIAVNNATKNWDGVLEYSTDTASWTEWDGTTVIASAEHGGEQKIYMRGVGNTKITGTLKAGWVLTGSGVRCVGNIENLLDWEIVEKGEHPQMATQCYAELFSGWTGLTSAPQLPATTMTYGCYAQMFYKCTNLVTIPSLPATDLEGECYYEMFYGCTSLKLSTTHSTEYPNEYRVPTSGEGDSIMGNAITLMFNRTGGTTTSVKINTTYYTANEVIYPDAPSAPIAPTSMLMGWLVGRQIAGMRGKVPVIPDVPVEPDEPSGEIVGYLYNGVQLPDISTIYTDDVKTDYPYAVIQYIKAADTYQFIASEKEWYETYAGSNVFKTGGRYQYTLVDVAWGNKYVTSTNGATYDLNERDFVWTNTDIYYQNGTLLLAASDPIPVYA